MENPEKPVKPVRVPKAEMPPVAPDPVPAFDLPPVPEPVGSVNVVPPTPPAKKKMSGWLIALIVVIVICCCIVAIVVGAFSLFGTAIQDALNSGEFNFDEFQYLIPLTRFMI